MTKETLNIILNRMAEINKRLDGNQDLSAEEITRLDREYKALQCKIS